MKAILASAALAALVSSVSAQTSPDDKSPERDAVVANDRAYEAAFEKGDVKALAAFFAEDAEYTTCQHRAQNGDGTRLNCPFRRKDRVSHHTRNPAQDEERAPSLTGYDELTPWARAKRHAAILSVRPPSYDDMWRAHPIRAIRYE